MRSTFLTFDQDETHRLKREALLRAASECFNELGYAGTSLKTVAGMLKVTDAALYYYVKSKEELAFLCYQRTLDAGEQALKAAMAIQGTSLGKLRQFVQNSVDAMLGDHGPIAVVSDLAVLKPPHSKPILARLSKHTSNVKNLVAAGVRDGSIGECDPQLTCDVLMGALAWIPKWHHHDSKHSRRQIADAYMHVFAEGLMPR